MERREEGEGRRGREEGGGRRNPTKDFKEDPFIDVVEPAAIELQR